MKKIKLLAIIPVLTFAAILFAGPSDSKAATSSWKSIIGSGAPSGCQVRFWTDASTYTKSADTVDFTIQQNGKCGTLNYEAYLSVNNVTTYSAPGVKGYFSNITPTKKLSVNIPVFKVGTRTAQVGADFTSSSGKWYGFAESSTFTVQKQ